MCCVFYDDYPNMHVTGMDRKRGDNEAMHDSVRRERQQMSEAEGVIAVPRRGRARGAVADDELQLVPKPQYEQMDVELEVQIDAETEEDVDDGQPGQRRRRSNHVLEPDLKCINNVREEDWFDA